MKRMSGKRDLVFLTQDAGYRGKSLFIVDEEEEDSSQKMDDEVSHVSLPYSHIPFNGFSNL